MTYNHPIRRKILPTASSRTNEIHCHELYLKNGSRTDSTSYLLLRLWFQTFCRVGLFLSFRRCLLLRAMNQTTAPSTKCEMVSRHASSHPKGRFCLSYIPHWRAFAMNELRSNLVYSFILKTYKTMSTLLLQASSTVVFWHSNAPWKSTA